MKKESALGLGLRLLGLALSLGPLLIAFSMHNWNIQETLIDTGGAGSAIGNVQNFLNMRNMGNLRPIQENATYDPATQTATLPLEISGIPFSLTVKEISITFTKNGEKMILSTSSPTQILPNENKIIVLTGKCSSDPRQGNWQSGGGEITIEKLGIEIKISMEGTR